MILFASAQFWLKGRGIIIFPPFGYEAHNLPNPELELYMFSDLFLRIPGDLSSFIRNVTLFTFF